MKLHGASSLASFILTSTLLVPHALANVEKVIFKAPGQEKAVFDAPGTDDVSQHTLRRAAWYLADLPKLTHTNFTLNADIEAGFPNASFPDGPATWMLLEDLNPGQRYEARVSWPATQPTSFDVDAFGLSEVMDDKESLYPSFAASLRSRIDPEEPLYLGHFRGTPSSRMLLRIQARADYFTKDDRLMREVPPVSVYIILDSYLLNILPNSLLFFSALVVGVVTLICTVLVGAYHTFKMYSLSSRGAVIMDEIDFGEADRDGDTSSMNRDSEDTEASGKGVFTGIYNADGGGRQAQLKKEEGIRSSGVRVVTRSMSRGRLRKGEPTSDADEAAKN